MKKYLKYLLVLLIIPITLLLINFNDTNKINKENKEIKKITQEKENSTEALRKKFNNNDIVGSISLDGLNINEAILHYSDNDYYLTHDNYGNYDKYGSVYMDFRCNKDSKKVLIFGHNYYNSDTPFSKLENYYEKSFYDKNPYINIILENEKRKYQIFSVYVETKDFTYMNLKIDENKYNEDLIKYKSKSFYETGVSVSNNDDILILQTCSNNPKYKKFKNKFLLIIAKKIEA